MQPGASVLEYLLMRTTIQECTLNYLKDEEKLLFFDGQAFEVQ